MNLTPQQIIDILHLEPLTFEGGYYRRTYLSSLTLEPHGFLSSAIYFMLTPDTYSRLHCLPADEIFHFYLGDPVEMLTLDKNDEASVRRLGTNLLAGEHPQFTVTAGTWQGSRLVTGGRFALLGTTMAPAFSEEGFTRPPDVEFLLSRYPASFHQMIRDLY